MKDLQEIINKKASKKLEDRIREINMFLYRNRDILEYCGIQLNVGEENKAKLSSLYCLFESWNLGDRVHKANLQKFIEQETEEFVKKVEELQSQIDELYNR